LAGKTVREVRRFAIETDRILVTLDADFGNLIRFSPSGTPGVIWITYVIYVIIASYNEYNIKQKMEALITDQAIVEELFVVNICFSLKNTAHRF